MAGKSKIDYEHTPEWADVVPIPQNEGSAYPLAAIAYSDEYSQAMSYLRAVMAANEKSERVLQLTEHIIKLNPAHYTVWLFRMQSLEHLQVDPHVELEWLNLIALKHLKNYQIWQHRQSVMKKLPTLPDTELPFLSRMLAKDAKNYHVWTYRVWMVTHFSLWPTPDKYGPELEFTQDLIQEDVMNNSAWSHRYTVQFNREKLDPSFTFDAKDVPEEAWQREINVAQKAICYMPQNQSPWWYLKGVVEKKGDSIVTMKDFALRFADMDKLDKISSSFALQLLVEIYKIENDIPRVRQAYELLASRFDPIRKNYYRWLLSYIKDPEQQEPKPEDSKPQVSQIAA